MKLCSLQSLKTNLQNAKTFLQQQNLAKHKFYLLTDGEQTHSNVIKINLRIFLIHLGVQQLEHRRILAAVIDTHFLHFNENNIDGLIRHILIDKKNYARFVPKIFSHKFYFLLYDDVIFT